MPCRRRGVGSGVGNPPRDPERKNVLDEAAGRRGRGPLTPSGRRLCCRPGLCRWRARSPAPPRRSCPACCRPRLCGDSGWSALRPCRRPGGAAWGQASAPPHPSGRWMSTSSDVGIVHWAPGRGLRGGCCPARPGENEAQGGGAAWPTPHGMWAARGPGSEPRDQASLSGGRGGSRPLTRPDAAGG